MNIYSEVEKFVKSNFSGNEEHQEMRIKILHIPKEMRSKIRDSVRSDFSTSQAIEWILKDRKVMPSSICHCGKQVEGIFQSLLKGYRFQEYCSTKCRSRDPAFKEKLAKTNEERYGHASNMWGDGVREETKDRWIEKFGVDNPTKAEIIKNKIKKTNLERRDVEWPMSSKGVQEKYKVTMLTRFGVDNSFKTGNSQKTMIEKYGVISPMHVPEILEKSQRFKRKTGIFPSGQEYSFQGYENVAVTELLKEHAEDEIKISSPREIPVIEYWNPVKGKLCHYFPDIWIPSKNLLIEVKSTYTMKKQLDENLAKQRAAKALGLDHQIWVCSKEKILEII